MMWKKLTGLFKPKPKPKKQEAKPVRGRVDPTDKRGGPKRAAAVKVSAKIEVNRIYSKKLNRWFTLDEYVKLTGANNG